mgnify:CR=1 FL=1
MKIIKTKFSNLLIFQGKKNKDSRGHLVEIFKQNLIKNKLKFDYFTTSKKNVLRGMHFQLKKQQDKLISVIKGKIIDFSIDLRKDSKTFGKIFSNHNLLIYDQKDTFTFDDLLEQKFSGFAKISNKTKINCEY